MSKKFVVSWTVPQWHEQWITVEAESEEEAIKKVESQAPISVAEGSEFLHNGDHQDFEIDKDRTKRVTQEHTLERTDIAENLLVAALEGGSGYWIEKFKFVTNEEDQLDRSALNYPEALGAWKNGGALLIISELDSGDHFNVIPYDILASAEKKAQELKLNLKDFHEQHDADDADQVLQLACFSDIIYS